MIRYSRPRSQHLAHAGARLAQVSSQNSASEFFGAASAASVSTPPRPAEAAAPIDESAHPSPSADIAAPDADLQSGAAFSVSPAMAVLLHAIAVHDRVSVPELIGNIANARARQIGLGALMRAVLEQDAEIHDRQHAAGKSSRHGNSRGEN